MNYTACSGFCYARLPSAAPGDLTFEYGLSLENN